MPILLIQAHLDDDKDSKCGDIGSYGQNQALRAHIQAENCPKTARTATEFGLARPKQEVLIKILNTPRLARNAPFAHVGAPTVDLSGKELRKTNIYLQTLEVGTNDMSAQELGNALKDEIHTNFLNEIWPF